MASTRFLLMATALGLSLSACQSGVQSGAEVEFQGSVPSGLPQNVPADPSADPSAVETAQTATGASQTPTMDDLGIITYPDYQAVEAQEGEALAQVAERIGVSATDLAEYNGLPEDYRARQGDQFVLTPEMSESLASQPTETQWSLDMAALAIEAAPETEPTPAETPDPALQPPAGIDNMEGLAPVQHFVAPGETVYSIARLYQVSVTSIVSWNGLGADFTVSPGQVLLIPLKQEQELNAPVVTNPAPVVAPAPVAQPVTTPVQTPVNTGPRQAQEPQTVAVSNAPAFTPAQPVAEPEPEPAVVAAPITPEPAPLPEPEPEPEPVVERPVVAAPVVATPKVVEPAQPVALEPVVQAPVVQAPVVEEPVVQAPIPAPKSPNAGTFVLPVRGDILRPFNPAKGPSQNEGIDFEAAAGSPVVAVADGVIAHISKNVGDLGIVILIRHNTNGGLVTVYGRVANVTLGKGDSVRKGQQIATVATGSPANLHFEVRKGTTTVLDPTEFF